MVDENDLGKFRITKFNGNDFSLWKDKVINALTSVECNQASTEEFDLNQNRDVNLKKDEKAKLILMSAIHDDILTVAYLPCRQIGLSLPNIFIKKRKFNGNKEEIFFLCIYNRIKIVPPKVN